MSYLVAEVLEVGAARIESYGWGRGVGGLCAGVATEVGAHATRAGQSAAILARYALARVIWPDKKAPITFVAIANWNDAPGRTQQEVVDVFLKAAKNERIAADSVA